MVELKEQIKVVAICRSIAKCNSDILQREREAWEEDFKEQITLVATTKQDVIDAEAELRELTLLAYAQTGNKTPEKGVGIREVTKIEYDPKEALKWALHHEIALSLDKKSFEGFAKATPLDFVQVHFEPEATIATDLSEFIKEEK